MSTNPLRREGAYWKPVLDYEHWDAETSSSDGRSAVATATAIAPETAVRHDLCRKCGAEFVVDSPYCRMCGRPKEGFVQEKKSVWQALDFYHLRQRLGLTIGAMVCLIVGLTCIGAAIATGFAYTANTFVEWQAIQAWRSEWLVAAGVAFICGILLKNPLK